MKKSLVRSLGLLVILGPSAALAQGSGEPAVVVACAVQGHDLVLYNRSAEALPTGTTIRWSAWNGRREGDHTLSEPLEPQIGLSLSGALGASYFWDRPCEAHIAPAQDQDKRNGAIHLQGGHGNAPVET